VAFTGVPLEQLDGAFSLSFSVKNLLALPDFEELFDLFEELEGMQVGLAGWRGGAAGRVSADVEAAPLGELEVVVASDRRQRCGAGDRSVRRVRIRRAAAASSRSPPPPLPPPSLTRPPSRAARDPQVRLVMDGVSSPQDVALLLSAFSIPTKIKPKRVRPPPPSPLLPKGEAAQPAA
jgi:hypothetical protein